MNHLIKITLSLGLLNLWACTSEVANPERVIFQKAPPTHKPLVDSDYYWGEALGEANACDFLASKRSDALRESGAHYKAFQLYRSFYSDDYANLKGAHAVSKLPQVLFMLSQEGSEDAGPMYRSYDRWSFYFLAKKKLCPTVPAYCEFLNNKDAQYVKLSEINRQLAELGEKIALTQMAARQARTTKDYNTLKSSNRRLGELVAQRDYLKGDIGRVESMIETLNKQVRSAAKLTKKKGTKAQVEAVTYLEDLIKVNTNWNAQGITNWGSYVDFKKKFTIGRNQYIAKTLNALVPGALDDQDYPLAGTEILVRYLRYLELAYPHDKADAIRQQVSNNIDTLRPLMTAEYSLFDDTPTPSSWVNLERDITNALSLISSEPVDILDATCKFVVSQRLIAQIVSMKGIRQSPKLTKAGFLEPLSQDPKHSIGHEDILGVFGLVVDEAWIQKMMYVDAQDIPLPVGTIDQANNPKPVEFFSAVRLFANIANTANAPFWTKNKNAPTAEELIPTDLLKFSFGLMAISLRAAQIHLFSVHVTDINLIPEDSPEGYTTLIHAAVESLQALESQYRMHREKPEMAFLQDEILSGIGESGKMKIQLAQLLYAATKRAMEFARAPTTSELDKANLRDAIHRAGAYLKNEILYLYE